MLMRWGILALPFFIYWYGIKGILFWLVIVFLVASVIELFTNKIGDIAGRLYMGRKADWSVREKGKGTLSEVRVQKMKGNFEHAYLKLEEILAKDKYFPEALFIKARILYEHYGDRLEALKCLDLVIEKSIKDEPVHRWAVKLKQDIKDDRR